MNLSYLMGGAFPYGPNTKVWNNACEMIEASGVIVKLMTHGLHIQSARDPSQTRPLVAEIMNAPLMAPALSRILKVPQCNRCRDCYATRQIPRR